MGKIVRIQSPAKHFAGKEFEQVRQWKYSLFSIGLEERPVVKVFFRPEESHGRSGIAGVAAPLRKRNGHIGNHFLRIGLQYHPIANFYMDRFTAIQTGRVYLYCFTRKKPADRQRFEGSLAEPFLLTVDGDAKLGGLIVEGRKGSNEIRVGGQPPWNSWREKFMQYLSTLFHGNPQFFRYFRIMGRLSACHHTLHNEVKSLIQCTLFIHDSCLLMKNIMFKRSRKKFYFYGLRLSFHVCLCLTLVRGDQIKTYFSMGEYMEAAFMSQDIIFTDRPY
jgi:hypothetical protein